MGARLPRGMIKGFMEVEGGPLPADPRYASMLGGWNRNVNLRGWLTLPISDCGSSTGCCLEALLRNVPDGIGKPPEP